MSERVNGRASGPVLTSGFLVDLAHCEEEAVEAKGSPTVLEVARGVEEGVS